MERKLIKIFGWIKETQIGLLLSAMMFFLVVVLCCWLYAFWSNGLYGTKFDLGSCWQGLTVVATGLVTVAGFASKDYVKHWIDSKYNSKEGESPSADCFKP